MAFSVREVRQVCRRLGRSPMFTAVTLITIAAGIGANTAIFSVINGVLIKPLPYPESDRLVAVWQTAHGIGLREVNASPSTYFTYREESRTFEDIALWRGEAATITGVAEPENVRCLRFTDGMLPLLRIQPALGRWFSRKDDSPGSPETVILTHGYWQRRFGRDPAVLGRRLLIDGRAREVIGVMPERFQFSDPRVAVILPFQFDRSKVFIGNFSYQALARLKPGATLAQANADVARMIPMLAEKFAPIEGLSMKMFEQARFAPDVRPLKQDVVGDVGRLLWVLMATVGIVFLIACANVANLMLVRAEGRRQEFAIRAALGAGHGGIAREVLAESVTLGLLGGALGLGLAFAGVRLLVYLAPAQLPRLHEIGIDGSALVFTVVISLVAGVLFGLTPVIKYGSQRLGTGLRESSRTLSEGRQRHRARNALVVVQMALALVLLVGSGLMVRTFAALRDVQPGFLAPDKLVTFRVSIPEAQVREPERVIRMYEQITRNLEAIPGATSVGGTTAVSMDGSQSNDPIYAEDRTYAEGTMPPLRRYKYVTPGYGRTMGNPLIAGRDFTWTDIYGRLPFVLINENLARELWGSAGAAIGKRVRESPKGQWRQVIGVVGNERDDGVDQPGPSIVYWPALLDKFWQFPEIAQRTMKFVVRLDRAGSDGVLKELQAAVWTVNAELPLADVRTVQEIYDRSLARTSFTLVMLGIASAMALLLGIVGIYGVISYSVTQRTREIGIRMAVGAPGTLVVGMFLRNGLVLAALGVACGLGAAVLLSRMVQALLFEVSPLDPVTFGTVPLVLLAAALIATYIPAKRATAVAPVDALRAE